jgi:hypothetical protein
VSESWIDPGSLEGDELTRWYLRSPAAIEQERQAAAARRYQEFFYGPSGTDPDRSVAGEAPASEVDVDPDFTGPPPSASGDADPRFTWVAVGPNRLRSVRLANDGQSANPLSIAPVSYGDAATASDPSASAKYQDDDPPEVSASEPDLTPRPTPQLDGQLRGPPATTYRPVHSVAAQAGPRLSSGSSVVQRVAAPHPPIGSPIHLSPATPPLPTFFSSLFGGPVPLTSPEGHVIGYYDHQAAKAGLGITAQYAQIASWLQPAGWMDGLIGGTAAFGGKLLSALGPEAERAVAEGIAEGPAAKAATQAFHEHHPEPMYMGGAADQERVRILDELHRRFHGLLGRAHREVGLPPVGGRTGSAKKWAEHYARNPGSEDQAWDILRRISREFDSANGTNISSKIRPGPNPGGAGAPPRD